MANNVSRSKSDYPDIIKIKVGPSLEKLIFSFVNAYNMKAPNRLNFTVEVNGCERIASVRIIGLNHADNSGNNYVIRVDLYIDGKEFEKIQGIYNINTKEGCFKLN